MITRIAFLAALAARLAFAGNVSSHVPISISAESDFTSCACVTGGTGSTSNPYIIGPWSISKSSGAAISVDGTNLTSSFTLRNLAITGNGSGAGVVLNHIPATIAARVDGSATSIQSNSVGILVENSSGVVIDGGGANTNGPGIASTNTAGTLNGNTSGAIDVENSDAVTITGLQMSANGVDGAPDFVGFDPGLEHWGVGGVRFFGVTNSTIDHLAGNNDTSITFSFFASSHNTLQNSTCDYPFTMNVLITDGSSFNTVQNNVMSTGDFFNIVVADPLKGQPALKTYGPSHDNVINGNTAHTSGPTGSETSAGEAPDVLGGIVILNGSANNLVSNNTSTASTGVDIGWAQETLDSSAIFGVRPYPPSTQCNVTQNNGGKGARNGNVWTGNVCKTIAPCLGVCLSTP